MHYPMLLAALAGLGSASPAAMAIDFDAILAATTPALTGPAVTATGQTGVYNAAAAASVASAAVTAVASASATQSVQARDVETHDALEKRTFCFFGFCWGVPKTTAKAATSTICTTSSLTVATATRTTSSAVITTPPAITTAPSSCTPISWTNTFAFTTATDCAQPFEVGTFCGFINPEDPCAVQPDGYGPHVVPDTVEAFKAYEPFHQNALSAKAPDGYAATFTNLDAAVSANTYLGLYTLKSYDVAACAAHCDSTELCTGINIYVERDPSINPWKCSCQNPASITNYKCTLWGSGVDKDSATNTGQGRDDFQVVITGSNGYEKTNNTKPSTPSGWTNPQSCGTVVHDHPSTCMGQKFFPGPFDINVCASYAASQNSKNSKSLGLFSWASWFGYSPLKCNFFNAFMIKENGVAKGTYCNLFSQQYAPSAASYKPAFSGGIKWSVESSWSFCSS
ncbi:CND3 protein [Colletotrichum truncatum]|uniref:CND3 protein n=1 Tax=Colletotrichum truncatum TaxID=5467 RepID=A0ACC3YE61_COLTU|nr:CND3 protein [Colletotrichum truncatum]KAF6790163.1 CND3 protein [Colletotrichum truncatum]